MIQGKEAGRIIPGGRGCFSWFLVTEYDDQGWVWLCRGEGCSACEMPGLNTRECPR